MKEDHVMKKTQLIGKTIFCLFTSLIILVLAGAAHAATYYVATTGNDANPGTISQPWKTPQKAWQSAQAGDTVYFRGGTYAITSTISTYSQGYHGTAGSPITFASYTGETATLDASGTAVVPVIRIEKDYNIVDGINLKSQGSFFTIGYDSGRGTGFTLKNSVAAMTVGEGDNSGIVKAYAGPSNVSIESSVITGPGTSVNANNAAIWFSRTRGAKVKNTIISGFPSGIYFKHSNTLADSGVEFSYNYIYGCTWGIHSVANYAVIKHNILKNTTDIYNGDDGGLGDGGLGCQYNTITHNTLMSGMNFQHQGNGTCTYNTVTNNIFRAQNQYAQYATSPVYMSPDHNLYISGNALVASKVTYTLTSWRTFLGGCPGTSRDCNSITGSPVFVGGASPSTITGFALSAGSPGKNAASDGTDMGANPTLVGKQKKPSAPAAY